MSPKDWDEFLIKMADTYQVKGKPRKVFLERFDYENWGKSDTEIKNISGVPSIETYKKHANTIYKQFSKDKPNGCPRLDSSDPGAGKFEILRTWLQETMYPQWLTEQQSKVSSSSPVDIDWREVCGKVLARQREEQRLRRQATERGFELNVYVPLGLVERKQQQRRNGDVPLEEVYQLTEEVITKEYDNDKFLAEVIEPGKSRRIAIIGEPGAGKTTLQEKIAVWIHDNNKGLPICIPLGGLQGKSLEDYLVQIWLKTALRFIEPDALGVEAQHIASLQKQFRESKVWLLLDGVDEMAATSPVEALATIKEQLTDWLAEARVVLTCRLNVWDANANNLLTGFETYRTLEFKPEQVEDFIRQWFACAKESQRGEELLRKLQETGKERIRELVRNPLRLSLLCQTSYVLPVYEPLPETKAALYERFTRYFYEWKQEQHLDLTQQDELIDELHEALGKLALAGINSTARFRLGRKLARQEMGDRLFNLACRLGWLNLVDRDAKTDDAVYAFFHPTFQEYFAACAIEDWHFFFNHVPNNPMQGNYRIFEPKWKEMILLWLGREDVERERKEQFIQALVEFEDECGDFYGYRAYFLAASGIAEFWNCNLADEIVEQILDWRMSQRLIAEEAKTALRETDRTRAIQILIYKLESSQNNYSCWQTIEYFGEVAKGNKQVIDTLIHQLKPNQPEFIRCYIAKNLGKIVSGNKQAIKTLTKLLEPSQDECIRSLAAMYLGEIDLGNENSLKVLIHLAEHSQDKSIRLRSIESVLEITKDNEQARKQLIKDNLNFYESVNDALEIVKGSPQAIPAMINLVRSKKLHQFSRLQAARILGEIARSNQQAINVLIDLLKHSQDEYTCELAALGLGEIAKDNQQAINALIDALLKFSQDTHISVAVGSSLEKIAEGNEQAVKTLISWLKNNQDWQVRWQSARILKKILKSSQSVIAVSSLKTCLVEETDTNNSNLYENCYEVIWHCAQNMPYPDFFHAWHQTTIHETG